MSAALVEDWLRLDRTVGRDVRVRPAKAERFLEPFAQLPVEIALVQAGTLRLIVAGREVASIRDRVVVVPLDAQGRTTFATDRSNVALWLDADLACELAEATEDHAEEVTPGAYVVDSRAIGDLLDMLVDEVTRDGGPDAADAIAESIVVEALGLLKNEPPKKAKTLDPRVKAALVRMDRDPAAPIGIDEIANGLKISRFELTRLFRRDIGRCPYPYVVASRLAHAVHLLETGKCSLVQAALASGFTDYDMFATLYVRAHARS